METQQIDDGGPIHPIPTGVSPSTGMSLRDHFAGLAMQAEMITSFSDATPQAAEDFQEAAMSAGREMLEHLAFNAYKIADAMIAVRKAKP